MQSIITREAPTPRATIFGNSTYMRFLKDEIAGLVDHLDRFAVACQRRKKDFFEETLELDREAYDFTFAKVLDLKYMFKIGIELSISEISEGDPVDGFTASYLDENGYTLGSLAVIMK